MTSSSLPPTPMTPLRGALEDFIGRVNANRIVLRMLADWERRILIVARDSGEGWVLVSTGAGLGPLEEAPAPNPAAEVDMRITGDSTVLTEIFLGRRNPVEEYTAGRLGFQGSARDEMRLDAVIQHVWE